MDAREQEKLLALRRQARAEKSAHDQQSLELHHQIVHLLYRGDKQSDWVRAEAFQQMELLEARRLCNPRYIRMWREWLDMPEAMARAAILDETDMGISMRQNSHFTAALTLVKQLGEPRENEPR